MRPQMSRGDMERAQAYGAQNGEILHRQKMLLKFGLVDPFINNKCYDFKDLLEINNYTEIFLGILLNGK